MLLLALVPRLLFDGWSYQDYMSVLASEDEIEELASELVDVAKVSGVSLSCSRLIYEVCLTETAALQTEGFDGFTLELWSQLGGNKKK